MILKAIGKCIDTLPIADLLSQEEVLADTVVFEVDRFHDGLDLAEFSFCLRGVTQSGGEVMVELPTEIQEQTIRLFWAVGQGFTAEAGTLSLDLFASVFEKNADPTQDTPTHVIRYQLAPVQVRPLPESDTILETHSYTDFLMQVKETANTAISVIEAMVLDFENEIVNYENAIRKLENDVSANTAAIAALTPIVTLTQSEYDALEAPQDGTLYLIKEDA